MSHEKRYGTVILQEALLALRSGDIESARQALDKTAPRGLKPFATAVEAIRGGDDPVAALEGALLKYELSWHPGGYVDDATLEAKGIDFLARELAAALAPPLVKPLGTVSAKLSPEAVWGDKQHGGGAVLRAGECAVLSGAGGVGKSFAAMALACVAATGKHTDVLGMHVRSGPVVLINYEDDAATLLERAGLMMSVGVTTVAPPDELYVVPNPNPLMEAHPQRPGGCGKVRRVG